MEPTRTPQGSSRRTPLAELQPRASSPSTSKPSVQSKVASLSRIPIHESVFPEGKPFVISRENAVAPQQAKKRVIAIYEDEAEGSKRDSQISTSSTICHSRAKR